MTIYQQGLEQDVLKQLFTEARTYNAWQERDVSDEQLMQIYDLVKMAPTSANCSPARFCLSDLQEPKPNLNRPYHQGIWKRQ